MLLDICECLVQADDIGAEILAVRALALVRAARLQFVIAPIAVVKVYEPDIVDGLREHIVSWPTRWRELRGGCDQGIVLECVVGEASVDGSHRNVFVGAARRATASVPDRILSGDHHVVGEDQGIHRSVLHQVASDHQVAAGIRKGGDVIDCDGVERVFWPIVEDFKGRTAADVFRAEVIDDDVMNAPACPSERDRPTLTVAGKRGCHLDAAATMRDVGVADGHISDLADRAYVRSARRVLILGRQQNAISRLAETSPTVFHKVRFGQHANRIL